MTVNPSGLCQIEIPVSDVERSLQFYQEVLGWTEAPCDIHDYKVFEVPEDSAFGVSLIGGQTVNQRPQGMILYFRTSDPDAVAAKATAFLERDFPKSRNLPGYGRVRVIEDPDGHRIGLYVQS